MGKAMHAMAMSEMAFTASVMLSRITWREAGAVTEHSPRHSIGVTSHNDPTIPSTRKKS